MKRRVIRFPGEIGRDCFSKFSRLRLLLLPLPPLPPPPPSLCFPQEGCAKFAADHFTPTTTRENSKLSSLSGRMIRNDRSVQRTNVINETGNSVANLDNGRGEEKRKREREEKFPSDAKFSLFVIRAEKYAREYFSRLRFRRSTPYELITADFLISGVDREGRARRGNF